MALFGTREFLGPRHNPVVLHSEVALRGRIHPPTALFRIRYLMEHALTV
jgi:hypothetical protein